MLFLKLNTTLNLTEPPMFSLRIHDISVNRICLERRNTLDPERPTMFCLFLFCCISLTQLIFEAKEQNGYYYIVFM